MKRCIWTARVSGGNWRTKLNVTWFAHRCANPLKIEAPPCHFAGVVSRQTSSANVRSYGVDRACRRDAYVSYKRCTAITAASTYAWGIRSRSASLSNENRGHSRENEQHAKQARHSEAVRSAACSIRVAAKRDKDRD